MCIYHIITATAEMSCWSGAFPVLLYLVIIFINLPLFAELNRVSHWAFRMIFVWLKFCLSLNLSSNFKIPDILSSFACHRKGRCSSTLSLSSSHSMRPLHISPDLVCSWCPPGSKLWNTRPHCSEITLATTLVPELTDTGSDRQSPACTFLQKDSWFPNHVPSSACKVVQFGGSLSSSGTSLCLWPYRLKQPPRVVLAF